MCSGFVNLNRKTKGGAHMVSLPAGRLGGA